MKVIISFVGLEDRQKALKSGRPFALQPLAGSTILGHILERLGDIPVQSYLIALNNGAEQVREWLHQYFPNDLMQIVRVNGDTDDTLIAALEGGKQFIDDTSLLFVSGCFITEANYDNLISSQADMSCLVQKNQELIPAEKWRVDDNGYYAGEGGQSEVHWAGACWFRRGEEILKSVTGTLDTRVSGIIALLSALNKRGFKIASIAAETCLGTGSANQLLHANARLMQLEPLSKMCLPGLLRPLGSRQA